MSTEQLEQQKNFATALNDWQTSEQLSDADAASFFTQKRSGKEQPVRVDTYRAWKLGAPPNHTLYGLIREVMGYDFHQQLFEETRRAFLARHTTPAGSFFQNATSFDALRAILKRCTAEGISSDAITIAIGRDGSRTAIRDFINGLKNFSPEVLEDIFKTLDRLEDALAGRLFEEFTPTRYLIREADRCRRELGLRRSDASTHLGMSIDRFGELTRDPRLEKPEHPIVMHNDVRKKLVSFIRDAHTKILERESRGEKDVDRWPAFLQILTSSGLDPKDVATAVSVRAERYLSWLRSEGRPQPEELDRIETFLEQKGLQPSFIPGGVVKRDPPAPPPQPDPSPAPVTTVASAGDRMVEHRLRVIEQRLELLWPLLPEDVRRLAGDGTVPKSTGLRFLITADSFQPIPNGRPLTPEERIDTIALITELRRRMKHITECGDIEAKRALAPHLAEALIVDHRVFDAQEPTVISQYIDDSRRALGLISPSTNNQPTGD